MGHYSYYFFLYKKSIFKLDLDIIHNMVNNTYTSNK